MRKADRALKLLGECSDGYGPEADEAWEIVESEIARLREALAEADDALACVSCAQDAHCSLHREMNEKIRALLTDEEIS